MPVVQYKFENFNWDGNITIVVQQYTHLLLYPWIKAIGFYRGLIWGQKGEAEYTRGKQGRGPHLDIRRELGYFARNEG